MRKTLLLILAPALLAACGSPGSAAPGGYGAPSATATATASPATSPTATPTPAPTTVRPAVAPGVLVARNAAHLHPTARQPEGAHEDAEPASHQPARHWGHAGATRPLRRNLNLHKG